MKNPVRLLYVEDELSTQDLIRSTLEKATQAIHIDCVDSRTGLHKALDTDSYDLILTDYELGTFTGLDVISDIRERGLVIPVIMLTVSGSEEIAIKAMKQGIADYVLKSREHIKRLPFTVEHVLERAEAERLARKAADDLWESEQFLKLAQEVAGVGTWKWDIETNSTRNSDNHASLFGLGPEKEISSFEDWISVVHPDDRQRAKLANYKALEHPNQQYDLEYRVVWPDGSVHWLFAWGKAFCDKNGHAMGIIGTVMDITERKQTEDKIRQTNKRLHNLTNQLQAAQEMERARIARDLHDELAQQLTRMKIDMTSLLEELPGNSERQTAKGQSIITLIDDMQDFVRKLSTQLRPSILDNLGLEDTLEWQLHESATREGFAYKLEMPDQTLESDNERDTAIYRIFQEILTNVTRHAQATFVDVSLYESDAQLVLTVKDNGIGIKKGQTQDIKALGLIGMRERAAAMGGNIQFEAGKDGGTQVTLIVPLQHSFSSDKTSDSTKSK